MVASALGILTGISLACFWHVDRAWAKDIAMAVAGGASLVLGRMARLWMTGAVSMPGSDLPERGTAAFDALPAWTRFTLALPGGALDFAACALLSCVALRLFLFWRLGEHRPDTVVGLDREALRAKLRAEMKYHDDLLD